VYEISIKRNGGIKVSAATVNTYHKSTTPPLRLAWSIWGWGAAFYLIGFFLRVTPAVMTVELMQASF
jgi:hypothetical protein